ncbi:MAG: hypothetical protein PHQ98_02600 [Candidatus ainarchaeum sp.]|nr:hypothetical protein [Candidatus ainarchaeum sp.]
MNFKNKSKIVVDEKGQAGAVFRLMVDGIVGLAILLIIISLLGYFNSLIYTQALTKTSDIVKKAYNSPTGVIVTEQNNEKLPFLKDSMFTSSSFAYNIGEEKECFTFFTNSSAIDLFSGQNGISFKQNLNVNVYAKCLPLDIASREGSYSNCDSKCKVCCLISFGKKLE